MARFLPLLFSFFFIAIISCTTENVEIKDFETQYSGTYQIKIFSNHAFSDEKIIDVTSSADYNSFKNTMGGFELRKITYLVRNANVPDDMYFAATILCSNEENTESYTLATISNTNLSTLSSSGTEYELNYSQEGMDKALSWLSIPGHFKIKSEYQISDSTGNPYLIDELVAGSNFELVILLYVTVKSMD